MMHPFANVAGLFEEPLMSWQGQFGDLIESLEFYETDEKRGFVRGARWGLAPDRRPDQHGPAQPGRRAGLGPRPPHPRQDASWPRRELGPVRRGPARRGEPHHALATVTDSSGIPAPEIHYRMSDNSRRMLDFHIERAKESMDAAGAYKIEVDRLMRYSGWHLLGTARMGDDPQASVLDRWNRAHDVAEPVRRRRLVLRHLVGREPDVDDRRDRPARGRPHGRDPLRAAGAGVKDTGAPTDLTGGMPATVGAGGRRAVDAQRGVDAQRRRARHLRGDRRSPHPGGAWHAVGGRRPHRRSVAVRPERPPRPGGAASSGAPRELGDDVGARLDALGRDDPTVLGALQLVIVAGYYTDRNVRELIGYPGQMALDIRSWEYPAYLEEGLIDAVLARGPVWRDPATGQRVVAATDAPRTYAERWTDAKAPEGGHDGRDRT